MGIIKWKIILFLQNVFFKANAAAAAALFASQIQQQNSSGGSSSGTAALQQAAALNLVSLQNFPFVDYARMIHVPNRKRFDDL